jgi:type I restriction enzyme S subunit
MTLGDFVKLQRGHDLPESKRRPGNVPVIGSFGITGYHDIAKAKGPGVTIGRSGASFGVVSYSPVNYWPHNAALYVTDFQGNDERFSYYLLKSIDFTNYNSGSAQPSLNRNYIYPIEIKVPCVPIQRKIAAILSAYDELIENNTRRIEILEEMARSIYGEWFVKFRFPGHEQVQMVDSELGLTPQGWLCKFSDYVDFKEGPGLRRWQYREEGIPFLNIRTLVNNNIDLSKVQFLDPLEVQSKYLHFLLKPYDHVVSSSGTLGRIVTIQSHHLPLMLNTSIIRMRPKNSKIGKWQLKHFLQSDYFQNQIRSYASGVAQMNYGPSHLQQMWIVAPINDIGQRYEELVTPIEELIFGLVQKNDNLCQTRDLLLPRLISGEMDVENLDINTGEIAA